MLERNQGPGGPDEPDGADADFARHLPEVMAAAAEHFPRPSPELVGRAVRRGRRLKAVRNVSVGSTALAVAVAGVLAGGLVHLPGTQPGVGVATGGRTHGGPVPVTAAQVVAALKAALPPGTISDAHGTGTGSVAHPDDEPTARLTYRKGGRTSVVEVNLMPVAAIGRLPDGTEVEASAGRSSTGPDTHPNPWRAQVMVKGGSVQLTEYGATAGPARPPTAATAALTVQQLVAAAHDAHWTPILQALATWQGPPPGAMSSTLRSLLPHGLELSGAQAGNGVVDVVADDGHGKALVMVSDRYDTGADLRSLTCGPGEQHCTSGRLPDGSRWKLSEGKALHGIVTRDMAVLHPDGRQVIVSETNSTGFTGTPDRATQLLTDARLKAIAENPAWTLTGRAGTAR